MRYNESSLVTGAKWFFLLAIVILAVTFALGFNVKNATWLNGQIASATADQMYAANDLARQKAELDLQLLRTQTEIQIAEQKQQADYEALKRQQELQAASLALSQKAWLQENLNRAFVLGLLFLMAAVSLVTIVMGIYAGHGLNKLLLAKAQAFRLLQPVAAPVQSSHHPSPEAQKARQREREARENEIIEKQNLAERINKYFLENK